MPLKSPTSYMGENPQENQYLQGNPSVDPNAQTSWMDQSQSSAELGWAKPAEQMSQYPSQPTMSTGLVGNGTALSSLTGGNINPGGIGSEGGINPGGNTGITGGWVARGNDNPYLPQNQGQQNQPSTSQPSSGSRFGQYTPEGYNLQSDSNSTKYQVGMILSRYPPGPEGLQAAARELAALGISVVGRDTIRLPDGTTADVGRAFSDTTPGASRAWQYNWSGPAGGAASAAMQGSPVGSYMGQPVQNSEQQTLMNQIMFQMYMRNRGNRGFGNYGGGQTMYPGGGVYDPTTGQTRMPRPGEPQ